MSPYCGRWASRRRLSEQARFALTKEGSWREVPDLVRRGSPPENDGFSYAELAYFHPFVQRFLYGGRYGSHVFDLYELPASAAKLIEITEKGSESNFDIQQILLYIFDDIALVTIQLCATSPLKWETALNVISYLRNVYFQHYEPRTNDAPSGPTTVWKGGGGIERVRILPLQAPQPDPPVDRGDEMRCAIESPPKFGQLQPKIHRHWRDLLAPLTNGEIQIRLLGDHRMAVMVFLGMEDVTSISDDAWFALTQADGANFPRYAPAFRGRELALTAYDRWWDPSSTANERGNPDSPSRRSPHGSDGLPRHGGCNLDLRRCVVRVNAGRWREPRIVGD